MSEPTTPRILSLPGGEEVGRAAPGALATFPVQAMERATGGPEIEGNSLRLQFEGSATFDAWIEAIDSAEHFVHFENYILRDDRVGRAFREALVAKARQGVPVRLVYDWVGCWATPRRYWRAFKEAGVEIRAFNRPSVRDPFGVLQRDHRKLVCVDGKVAFVGGFCVGAEWAGTGDEPPWRDTGVEIRGPAAAAACRAFERIWNEIGSPVPEELRLDHLAQPRVGEVPVWLIEGEPGRSRVYRSLQLVAAFARRRLWITDPYFVAPRPVAEALAAAARDDVDVRILVPGHNNWPWVGSLSRGGYRFLLEAGVRMFEWQGPMIHAKTSSADGIWGRVGSSNLNTASLLGNWEIDVGILDESLATQLEGLFLADLASSVEIVLPRKQMVMGLEDEARRMATVPGEQPTPKASLEPEGSLQQRLERNLQASLRRAGRPGSGGSTGWRVADLMRASTALGDAIAGHRALGREDRTVLGTSAVLLVGLAVLAAFFPAVIGWVVAAALGWMGIVTAVRAVAETRRARGERARMEREMEEDLERDLERMDPNVE